MLYAIIAVLTVALTVSLILLFDQRRQVRDICRQLAFLKEQNSNLLITTGIGSKQVQELAEAINGMIVVWRNNSDELMKNREVLRNTIMSLSHDIRTPLTSLTGYFQLMNESTDEAEKERFRIIIENRITSLKMILEELFTYARLQDENYILEMTRQNLSKLTYDALFGYYEDFKEIKIEPVVDIEDGIFINSNEEAIVRILQNLIRNVLLHSLSRVRFELKRLKAAEGTDSGKYVELIVSNDVAKPEDIVIERVFERFYKAESERGKGSTGLGLSIVKGLTEKLGGSVKAERNGDIFLIRVSLPMVTSEQ